MATTLYPLGGATSPKTEVVYWEGSTYMASYTFIPGQTTTHVFDHLDLYIATKKSPNPGCYWAYQTILAIDVSSIPAEDDVSAVTLSMALLHTSIDNDFTINVYALPAEDLEEKDFIESDASPYPSANGYKVASIATANVVAGQNAFTSLPAFATAVEEARDDVAQILYLVLVSSRQEAEIQEDEGDNSEIAFKAEDHAEGQSVYPKLVVEHGESNFMQPKWLGVW